MSNEFVNAILNLVIPESEIACKGDDITDDQNKTAHKRGSPHQKSAAIRRKKTAHKKAHQMMMAAIDGTPYFKNADGRLCTYNRFPWKASAKKAANKRVRKADAESVPSRKGGYKDCTPFYAYAISRD